MWNQPYLFLVLCMGTYYYVRSRRTFAENFHKPTGWALLSEQCDKTQRRGAIKWVLLSMPNGVSALSWMMLVLMLKQGGAGSLFWYAVFSLLWMKPLGALATLWAYYRDAGEKYVDLGNLAQRMQRRKQAVPLRWARGLLHGVQVALLCCFLHPAGLVFAAMAPEREPAQVATYLAAAVAVWLLCRAGGERGQLVFTGLFVLVLAVAAVANLANLIPTLKLVMRDAFHLNRFLFALSGAGLTQMLGGGAQLSAGTLLFLGTTGGEEPPSLPHPACHAVLTQLRAVLTLVLQCTLGVLYLCGEIVPQSNVWVRIALGGFLCVFGVEFFARNLAALRHTGSRRLVAWVGGTVAALLLLEWQTGAAVYTGVLFFTLWTASICLVALLLYDGDWHFVLLEDYRDICLWRVEPYPRISKHHSRRE